MIAAATVGVSQIMSARNDSLGWQQQAWQYYDAIGELRFAANWLGNALSRATLHIARPPEPDSANGQPERDDDAQANEALAALGSGVAGQAAILHAFAVQLTVAGDCYLLGFDPPSRDGEPTQGQKWIVRSSEEVNTYPGKVTFKFEGEDLTLDEDNVAIVRIWRPHPRYSWQADSPTRGVLPILHELERLTQMILAQANSRLAGAGLLLIPNEFDFPTPSGYDADEEDSEPVTKAQGFVNRLGYAMTKPVADRSDPSAVVPVVVTAPGDQIGNAKLIQFWTGLDAQAIELRKEAVRRFSLGMDMPPEVLLGMGDVNHWGQWQIDDDAIRLHIEPLLTLICEALTVGFLRPLIGADSDLMVWFDTTELVQRPNRAPDAFQLYDRNELSGDELRAAAGYGNSAKPSDVELTDRQLRKLVDNGGVALAEQAAVALGLFDDTAAEDTTREQAAEQIDEQVQQSSANGSGPPARVSREGTASEPGPPASGGDGSGASSRTASGSLAVAQVTPVLVAHALDYVGKRWLKGQPRGLYPRGLPVSRIHERIPVPPEKADELLAGAFDALNGTVEDHVIEAVHDYVHALIVAGHAHDPRRLANALSAGCQRRMQQAAA